jgi:hypothetical protein
VPTFRSTWRTIPTPSSRWPILTSIFTSPPAMLSSPSGRTCPRAASSRSTNSPTPSGLARPRHYATHSAPTMAPVFAAWPGDADLPPVEEMTGATDSRPRSAIAAAGWKATDVARSAHHGGSSFFLIVDPDRLLAPFHERLLLVLCEHQRQRFSTVLAVPRKRNAMAAPCAYSCSRWVLVPAQPGCTRTESIPVKGFTGHDRY